MVVTSIVPKVDHSDLYGCEVAGDHVEVSASEEQPPSKPPPSYAQTVTSQPWAESLVIPLAISFESILKAEVLTIDHRTS
jgi:hypothetical protein